MANTYNNDQFDNEYIPFVASIFLASTEGRDPFTPGEAKYSISQWRKEGMDDIPKGLTGRIFAQIWNSFLENEQ